MPQPVSATFTMAIGPSVLRETVLSSVVGKFNGVGQQIVPHQRQQLAVCFDRHIFFYVGFYFQLLGFPLAFKGKQTFSELFPQVIGGHSRIYLLIILPLF